jgi:hypothetical protein
MPFTFIVLSSVYCGIGSEFSFYKLKDRNWVPNIEQKYNIIPSEFLQIFLGIYAMGEEDISPSLKTYVRTILSRTMSP